MASESDAPTVLSPEDERRVLWLTVVVVLLLIGLLAATSYVIWSRDDIQVMWVPIAIIEWAFAGGMVSVLYRLATRRGLPAGKLALYTWVIAKPVIGLFMGSLVYFLALAGAKLLDTSPPAVAATAPAAVAAPVAQAVATPLEQKPVDPVRWLNVVAFVGGFSDELSVGLILRFVRRRLGSEAPEEGSGERRKPAAEGGG